MNATLKWALYALTIFAAGCASVDTAKSELGTGVTRTYSSAYEDVWDAATQALPSLGLSVTSADKSDNTIVGAKGVSAFSWGERVVLRISREGAKQTKVEVISKRAYALNFTSTDSTQDILQRIGDALPGAPPNATRALFGDAREAFSDFQQRPYPRAFVIADGGRWYAVWGHWSRSMQGAANEALEKCKKAGGQNCKAYAANADVVWRP